MGFCFRPGILYQTFISRQLFPTVPPPTTNTGLVPFRAAITAPVAVSAPPCQCTVVRSFIIVRQSCDSHPLPHQVTVVCTVSERLMMQVLLTVVMSMSLTIITTTSLCTIVWIGVENSRPNQSEKSFTARSDWLCVCVFFFVTCLFVCFFSVFFVLLFVCFVFYVHNLTVISLIIPA